MASQDWVDKDFYAILGIAKDASDADIKKAYRKLARQYHPDTNSGDAAAEKKFKDISEAYSVLSDADERQQYDAIRAMGGGARFAPGGGGAAGGNGGFEDLFGGLFTGNTGRHAGGFNPSAGGIPPEFADLFGGGFGGVARVPADTRRRARTAPQPPASRSPVPSAAPPSACANPTAKSSTFASPPASRTARRSACAARASPARPAMAT